MSETNKPAFPVSEHVDQDVGLSKREYLAGLAMQGLCSINVSPNSDIGKLAFEEFTRGLAKHALAQADALLAELERTK